jgi:hypothetical protein
MKKILAIVILSVAMVSCYEDYIYDFDYTGVYFPYQMNVRTFVVGEGMKVQVGAALSGVRENTFNRDVNFVLDNSLITPSLLTRMQFSTSAHIRDYALPLATLQPMPSNYFSFQPAGATKMVIKTGDHMGAIFVKADSANFLADPLTINAQYVLPFKIESSDADTILLSKNNTVIGFRYENMLFGKYWHGGAAVVNRPAKTDTTLVYKTTIPIAETKIWVLKTTAPNALYANGYFDQTTAKNEMMLTLDGNNVTISSVPGSTFTFTQDGPCTFNRAKLLQDRKIFLKYSYLNPGNGYTYHCTDTLTFRNRIRDGVNEWQDENPSHYTK